VLFVAAAVLVVIAVRRRRLDRLAVVCCLAPAYWCVVFGASLYYQDWIGRYFAFPFVLAAATWGIVFRWRPVAWGVVAIAGTTLFLSLANDAKRPSGLQLLEGGKPRSIWNTPRWTGVALRDDYDAADPLSGPADSGLSRCGSGDHAERAGVPILRARA